MVKAKFPPVDEQIQLILRGTDEILQLSELEEKLQSTRQHRPLRVKAGFDPTAPHLHLGHVVLLQKLKTFQELGHQVIFLIGDFTARIGDPSGMSETRKPLTEEQIEENAKTYQQQVFKVLDREKTVIRRNSEWMSRLTAAQLIQLAGQYTLARVLERDDFQKRFREQRPISLHEFLYPLLQGYDSVVLEADVEIGGRDQKFNLLVGRELQKLISPDLRPAVSPPKPQVVITLPLLEGTDAKADEKGVLLGRKMSKTTGNAIGLEEPPSEVFGKIMSISDELMWRFYELLTDVPLEEVKRLHPKEAKDRLAQTLVTRLHDASEARKAAEEFERRHGRREFLAKEEVSIGGKGGPEGEGGRLLLEALYEAKVVSSKGEARRLIGQRAVEVDGERIQDPNYFLKGWKSYEIRVGKRRFVRINIT